VGGGDEVSRDRATRKHNVVAQLHGHVDGSGLSSSSSSIGGGSLDTGSLLLGSLLLGGILLLGSALALVARLRCVEDLPIPC